MISDLVKLFAHVEDLNTKGQAITAEPVRPRIQTLIDVGLLRSSRLLCGPLGLPSGEVWLRLTDDGRMLLPANDDGEDETPSKERQL